jgi:hypothetical protein
LQLTAFVVRCFPFDVFELHVLKANLNLSLNSQPFSVNVEQSRAMERMQRVLIISYDYPAISAAGVIRTYQFAKRLPEFGWQPIILSGQKRVEKEYNIEVSDGELPCPKCVAASRFSLPRVMNHHAGLKAADPNGEPNGRMKRWIDRAGQLTVPDGKIAWLVPAIRRGAEIAHQYPIEACLSVSPRPTAHLVAYRLARRFKIPWVADFALPWSDAYWLAGRPRLIESLDMRLEILVVGSAQRVTVAYPELGRRLGARYGRACTDKITVIPTGFDEDLFKEPEPRAQAKFTVVYPGNHFCEEGRGGEYFLRAIDEWLDANPELEEKVEFVFIGKRDEKLLRHRKAMSHSRVVRVEALASHRACVQAIRSSDLCVVNTVGNRIPGKVYECIRAGKWILALTGPESDLSRILSVYPRASIARPRHVSAICQALERQYNNVQSMAVMRANGFLAPYSAHRTAELLATVFNNAVESSMRRFLH